MTLLKSLIYVSSYQNLMKEICVLCQIIRIWNSLINFKLWICRSRHRSLRLCKVCVVLHCNNYACTPPSLNAILLVIPNKANDTLRNILFQKHIKASIMHVQTCRLDEQWIWNYVRGKHKRMRSLDIIKTIKYSHVYVWSLF